MLQQLALHECNHFLDGLVQVDSRLSGRRLFYLIADAADDVARAIGVVHHALDRFPDFHQIRGISREKAQRGMGVVACRTNRLIDLVRDRGGKLSHRCQAIRMRQIHLQRAKRVRSVLALRKVEHERDALLPAVFESRRADQYGHTASILAEELLLVRLQGAGPLDLRHVLLLVTLAPFRRRHVRPADAVRRRDPRGHIPPW